VLDRNIRAGAERVAIFEIGRTFYSAIRKRDDLGVLLWGNVACAANWRSVSNRSLDLFDLKARWNASFQIFPFAPENFLISRCRSTFSPAIG